jgi:hypothetical protein
MGDTIFQNANKVRRLRLEHRLYLADYPTLGKLYADYVLGGHKAFLKVALPGSKRFGVLAVNQNNVSYRMSDYTLSILKKYVLKKPFSTRWQQVND